MKPYGSPELVATAMRYATDPRPNTLQRLRQALEQHDATLRVRAQERIEAQRALERRREELAP